MQGERIEVKTTQFEGPAVIHSVHPGEMFPVQIELENPDPDGHCMKRIAWHEIFKSGKVHAVVQVQEDMLEADNGQLGFDF